MNRQIAARIRKEKWMTLEGFGAIMDEYGIEYSEGNCPELGYEVIWVKDFKAELFSLAHGELNIETNLRLWYDTGTEEILINENNYRVYDSSLFYDIKTGKYDTDLDI
jgi:hypothetical protein